MSDRSFLVSEATARLRAAVGPMEFDADEDNNVTLPAEELEKIATGSYLIGYGDAVGEHLRDGEYALIKFMIENESDPVEED